MQLVGQFSGRIWHWLSLHLTTRILRVNDGSGHRRGLQWGAVYPACPAALKRCGAEVGGTFYPCDGMYVLAALGLSASPLPAIKTHFACLLRPKEALGVSLHSFSRWHGSVSQTPSNRYVEQPCGYSRHSSRFPSHRSCSYLCVG